MNVVRHSDDYARVERAIHFIQDHVPEQPSLAQVARDAGLSEFHFQRLFQRWAGVSPKRFLQFLTLEEAKRRLEESRSLLETSFDVGLSGPSRLHDLFLTLERMTPGAYKKGGEGLALRWGVAATPFGPALFAATDRGLCGLSFVGTEGEAGAVDQLRARWPDAGLAHSPSFIRPYADELRARAAGKPGRTLSLILKGTPLQFKVWEALLRIPSGRLAAYSDVARLAGVPRAARAVGAAVGQNPIAYLIPCHRVILSTGAFGGYRWGSARKAAILGVERARASG